MVDVLPSVPAEAAAAVPKRREEEDGQGEATMAPGRVEAAAARQKCQQQVGAGAAHDD